MKKKFIVPIMALFAACLLVLTGCGGPSAEQLIREDLEAQFAEVKADNGEMLEAIESSAGENFDSLGIDPGEFMNTYLDGFAYTINEITVEDKTANANVTVTAKSMGDIVNEFQLQFTEYLSGIDLTTISGEEELFQQAGQILLEVAQSVEPQEVDCNFTYSQDDEGVWSADESAASELTNALMN